MRQRAPFCKCELLALPAWQRTFSMLSYICQPLSHIQKFRGFARIILCGSRSFAERCVFGTRLRQPGGTGRLDAATDRSLFQAQPVGSRTTVRPADTSPGCHGGFCPILSDRLARRKMNATASLLPTDVHATVSCRGSRPCLCIGNSPRTRNGSTRPSQFALCKPASIAVARTFRGQQ